MANNSMFDDSLIGKMLNETFMDSTHFSPQDSSIVKVLQESRVNSVAIIEYPTFWRVDIPTGPVDFPVNWSFVKDSKRGLSAQGIVFIALENDYQSLCKIFKTDLLGIYQQDGQSYFFSTHKRNLNLFQYLNANAKKLVESNSALTSDDGLKMAAA